MNELPKIFCLTLKDTKKRKEYAEKHFKQNQLDVEFFDGINGKKFGLHTHIPYMDDNPNWTPDDGPVHFISSGHIGCILSHYMLWKTLMYLPYDEIIIFEDDVILCEDFKKKFIQYKSQLPNDWQYVFIGNCCLPSEDHHKKINDNIIITDHPPMCTHAYMIKKSSIQVLIDTNSLAWSHIDIQIQKRSLTQLKYYIFHPTLANQKSIIGEDTEIFSSLTKY
jgi:GR25 family glycosyltransferase involved in LPS biosynthesis